MHHLSSLDIAVLSIYLLGIGALTWRVRRRDQTTEQYFVAGRSMPAWTVALAMMAALISSNTLVAHPATVYQKGMILLLGSLTLPLVLFFVARYIVPFYRNVVGMSAYEYLGARFGMGGRLYASACFVADRLFDVGITMLTTAIPITVMTGWDLSYVILALAAFTVVYTMVGGMEAVVWTGVAQGAIFVAAALLLVGRLVFAPEVGPPGSVVTSAWAAGKFALGSFELSWKSLSDPLVTTQWLFILAYGANWARRYIADQHMVQRYLIAKTDRDASRAAVWNGLVCVPVWLVFMTIGACLFGYYRLSGETAPTPIDNVVPVFILAHLPTGLVGALLAAILAASMSSISPDLNSVATVLTADHINHFFPGLSDRRQLFLGRIMVAVGGSLATVVAMLMVPKSGAASIMERGVTVAAVLSGGMLGLFFLGFLTRRATRTGCYAGIAACLLFTTWGILTEPTHRSLSLPFNFNFNPILIGLFGHVILFVVGYVTSLFFGGYRPENVDQFTFRRKTLSAVATRTAPIAVACAAAVLAFPRSSFASIAGPERPSPRIEYAIAKLRGVLGSEQANRYDIDVGPLDAPNIKDVLAKGKYSIVKDAPRPPEGFTLVTNQEGAILVAGNDDSGVLYGCLELARRFAAHEMIARNTRFADAPVFVLRGPCIGMQKTYLLPGRKVYEYPYTPELFPFFYDQAFWREYLDFLAEQRMNTLYLWNGHPFASLVRLPDYPEAVEVSDQVFARNVEMFRWLANECDRRGIWLVQQFYSILLSKPFAEKHGLSTQLNSPTPLAADYTRKSIAEFVRQYPNVGLMPCLGEALQNQDAQTHWCTDVILAGVKDGMTAAKLTHEPPVILRTHATDATKVMPEALKVYRNLYTEAKFNGESLTTWEPRGVRQQLHLAMSQLGSTHIANVHILANLEPFRYGDVTFIQKSVVAMRDRLGARGLHLYPLFYWNWPNSPDIAAQPLKQWRRDWIWFEAWARYAWNPDRPAAVEQEHWLGEIGEHYGSAAAGKILEAYNAFGECAPRLLRRYGITEGNRQTLSLGMTLDELVHPEKYREFPELWESQSPPGERLKIYAEREWKHEPHEGETPPSINAEVLDFSAQAVAAIEAAAPLVTKNQEEFARLKNDVFCVREMSLNYVAKARSALAVLRFGYSKSPSDMAEAEDFLAQSLAHYRKLAELTKGTYTAANSMQTSQRRIPVPGGKGGQPANFHWTQLVPLYEKELADFRAQVAALKDPATAANRRHAPLTPASFKLLSRAMESFTVQVGNTAFSDSSSTLTEISPELEGLQGIKFSLADAKADRLPPIEIETSTPVRILVGYFNAPGSEWRKPPTLETDASAADRGGAEPFLLDAVKFDQLPGVTIHAFEYPAGKHTLDLHGTGAFTVLGIAQIN